MTRLNLVPPAELADQHLFAEFREIKMVPKSLARSIVAHGKDGVLRRIPDAYTLGKGHVSFFYDKGAYLRDRYAMLRHELRQRFIQFNEAAELDPDQVYYLLDSRFNMGYAPTADALALVRQRIAERLAARPGWYRWTGRSPRLA